MTAATKYVIETGPAHEPATFPRPETTSERHPHWADVPDEDWFNWRWQLSNRLQNADDLRRVFPLDEQTERVVNEYGRTFRMGITPYFASLIQWDNPWCPVKQQMVPLVEAPGDDADMEDPLHEDADMPVRGLTHRYPDRVLWLATDECAVFCRYCTRRRLVGGHEENFLSNIDARIDYLRSHPEIRDVLVSGGDVLTMNDRHIETMFRRLREVPSIEIVRLGTRVPVVNPMRVTEELVAMMRKYHPVYVNIHVNHPTELTPEVRQACAMMADAGIPLGNQSVLLRGVNDCPHVMKKLCQKLLTFRVKPYYIYQCDLSVGLRQFRTSVSKGIEIIEALRGHTTGMAVPTFVVDAPGGGGKIPVGPQYVLSRSQDTMILRNFEGVITSYHEPHGYDSVCGHDEACKDPAYRAKVGPAKMYEDAALYFEPKESFLK